MDERGYKLSGSRFGLSYSEEILYEFKFCHRLVTNRKGIKIFKRMSANPQFREFQEKRLFSALLELHDGFPVGALIGK